MKQGIALLRRRWLYPGAAFAWNMVVYCGARLLTQGLPHQNWESSLDLAIPLIPWTVLIYLGSYVFWTTTYCVLATGELDKVKRFFLAEMLAKTVCLVVFILVPTTNTRPEVVGASFWDDVLRLVYRVDAPDNLFPSIHCLVSWMCAIGVYRDGRFPVWTKLAALVCALAIFLSTLTTKQHIIVDVIAGAALAEVFYLLAGPLLKLFQQRKTAE